MGEGSIMMDSFNEQLHIFLKERRRQRVIDIKQNGVSEKPKKIFHVV